MPPVSIRKVDGTDDAIGHCLLWLQRTILPADEPRELSDDHWWIAYQGGNPVGFAALKVTSSWAYLSRSGVLRSARGHGLQKRMIRVRVQFARRNGIDFVCSDTTHNPASANSLISEGFKTYMPSAPWALKESIYWFKKLQGKQ